MEWFYREILIVYLPTIVRWLLGGIVQAMITLWGKRSYSWSWPYAIAFFLVTLASGLVILNAITWEGDIKTKEIENKLHGWVYKAGFSIKDDPQESTRFQFIVSDRYENNFTIYNLKKHSISHVTIGVGLKIEEDSQEILMDFSKERHRQFVDYIEIELFRFGLEFDEIQYPLKRIRVSRTIFYDDSLTQIDFLNDLMLVRRAFYFFNKLIVLEIRGIKEKISSN